MRGALHAVEVWLCTAAVLAVCVPAGALTVTITQPADHTVYVKGDAETFKGVIDDFGDEYADYAWWFHEAGEGESGGGGVVQQPGPKHVQCGPRTFAQASLSMCGDYAILVAAERDDPNGGPPEIYTAQDTICYTVAGLEILPNPEDKTTCVGVQHSFSAQMGPVGVDIPLHDYEWSVGGQRIKWYDADSDSAAATELSAGDLVLPYVWFHWYDGGTADVGVSAKLVNGTPVSAPTQTWTIEEPSNVSFTLTPGPQAGIGVHPIQGVQWLELGDLVAGPPAMDRSGSATMPTNFGGKLAIFQEICTSHTGLWAADNTWYSWSTGGVYRGDFPQNFPTAENAGGAGTAVQVSKGDWPGVELPLWTEMILDYDFEVWLLFKPDSADRQWVPLKKGTWNGNASASLVNGVWTLNAGALKSTVPMTTTAHPEWTQCHPGQMQWQ